MKKMIGPFDCAAEVCKAMSKGILLTTKAGDKVNTMTIGWGTLGIEWGKPIFVAYVRESRYTRELLDSNGEFTVNVPLGEGDKKAIMLCGTQSGRDMDKIGEAGLTLVEPEVISVPGLKEFPLTLECRVLFKNTQDETRLPEEVRKRYYSAINDGDFHHAYYGEIVSAYIIEE